MSNEGTTHEWEEVEGSHRETTEISAPLLSQSDRIAEWEQGRYTLSWGVHRNYTDSGGVIAPVGPIVRRYDPREHPQVAADFARLASHDQLGARVFARRWGLLGYEKFSSLVPDSLGILGEPIQSIQSHASGVRTCLDLIYCLKHSDPSRLSNYLRELAHHPQIVLPEKDGTKVPSIRYGVKDGNHLLRLRGLENESEPRHAKSIILTILNRNVGAWQLFVAPTSKGDSLEIVQGFESLLEVVYWHTARLATGQADLAICEQCGNFFVRTDARQRFCPPTWFERDQARRFRKKMVESQCAQKARMARFKSKHELRESESDE